ncbi:MAG: hypothetical protein ACREAU_00465 [Nitrosopumilaceae archaeon]
MKHIICIALFAFNIFGAQLNAQQPNPVFEAHMGSTEDRILKRLITENKKLLDFDIIFIHEFNTTQDKKLSDKVTYICDFKPSVKQGRCITTTYYYMDPDCWACKNPFEATP